MSSTTDMPTTLTKTSSSLAIASNTMLPSSSSSSSSSSSIPSSFSSSLSSTSSQPQSMTTSPTPLPIAMISKSSLNLDASGNPFVNSLQATQSPSSTSSSNSSLAKHGTTTTNPTSFLLPVTSPATANPTSMSSPLKVSSTMNPTYISSTSSLPLVSEIHNDTSDEEEAPLMMLTTTALRDLPSQNTLNSDDENPTKDLFVEPLPPAVIQKSIKENQKSTLTNSLRAPSPYSLPSGSLKKDESSPVLVVPTTDSLPSSSLLSSSSTSSSNPLPTVRAAAELPLPQLNSSNVTTASATSKKPTLASSLSSSSSSSSSSASSAFLSSSSSTKRKPAPAPPIFLDLSSSSPVPTTLPTVTFTSNSALPNPTTTDTTTSTRKVSLAISSSLTTPVSSSLPASTSRRSRAASWNSSQKPNRRISAYTMQFRDSPSSSLSSKPTTALVPLVSTTSMVPKSEKILASMPFNEASSPSDSPIPPPLPLAQSTALGSTKQFHDPVLQKVSRSLRSLKSIRSNNSTSSSPYSSSSSPLSSIPLTKPTLSSTAPNAYSAPVRVSKKRLKVENERATMGWFELQLYTISKKIKQWTLDHKDGIFSIWSESLKLMEGRFGTGVASYFVLARLVFFLNVLLAFFMVINLGLGFASLNDTFVQGSRVLVGQTFVTWFQENWPKDVVVSIQSFFAGIEPWQYTPMFYASYRPYMLQNSINMDLIYISTVFCLIFASFLFLLVKIRGEFVNKSGLSTGIGVDDVYPFSAVLFASWNHAIDTPHVKTNLCFAISTVFKTLISRFELEAGPGMSWKAWLQLLLRRVVSNLLSVSLLAVAGLIIYDSVRACDSLTNTFLFRIVMLFEYRGDFSVSACRSSQQTTPFAPYLVSVFNALLPGTFSSIARFEKYKDPQWETRATLARSYLIKVASIYLMLFSLSGLVLDSTNEDAICWEHEVAKRFYGLQWLDLTLTCITTVLSATFVKSIWGTYQFDITSNILELVYRQSITWIGSIYAPVMPFVAMFSTTIIFFVKKWTVQRYADPPRRIYNSYSQVIWFLIFMLITLVLMMVPALFVLTLVQPSMTCGPYRVIQGYPIQFKKGEGAYQVIIKSISNMQDNWLKTILNALGSVAVIAPIIGFLSLWVYFLLAVAEKRNKRLIALENEVREEREDKRNLIRFYGVQL